MANLTFSETEFVSKKVVTTTQNTQTVRISVKNDVARVLSVGAESAVTSYDCTDGSASFYGKTNVKFLYFDGVSIVGSTYQADFTSSIDSAEINAASRLVFDVQTLDVSTETNANTATITILSQITVTAYVSDNVTYLSGVEGAYALTENLEALTVADVVNLPLTVEGEFDAEHNVSTVLLAESTACLSDYDYNNDDGILSVSGRAVVRLTYLSDGEIVTESADFPFQKEVDAGVILPQTDLYVRPQVRSVKVRLNIAENQPDVALSVEVGVNLRVETTKTEVVAAVVDAYGSDCDFDFERKQVQTTLPCGTNSTIERQTITVDWQNKGKPVSLVNPCVSAIECDSACGSATVKGVVSATVLCVGEQGMTGEPVELPFLFKIPVDYLTEKCSVYAAATLCDLSFVFDGAQTEFTEDLKVDLLSRKDVTYSLIVQATEKTFDKRSLPAMEVCLAKKGETLWQLAKNLHMSEDEVVAANPEVTSPLTSDARIVVYNKL